MNMDELKKISDEQNKLWDMINELKISGRYVQVKNFGKCPHCNIMSELDEAKELEIRGMDSISVMVCPHCKKTFKVDYDNQMFIE